MDRSRKRKLALTRLRVRKFRVLQKLEKNLKNERHSESDLTDDSSDNNYQRIADNEIEGNRSADRDYNANNEVEPVSGNDNNSGSDDEVEEIDEESNANSDQMELVHNESENEVNEPNPPPNDFNADQNDDEINQLKKWAITHKIAHAHLDHLLRILKARLLPNLPASSKTFLNTAGAKYKIKRMRDGNGSIGEFAFIGIKKGLMECINTNAHNHTRTIELQFNCDGLSLSRSSSHHIWPILCKLHSNLAHYEPFVVALYCGQSKPKDVAKYMEEFITEMNDLLENGVTIAEVNYAIKIKCFICDTPARAFLKCTKGHTSANACERCETRGVRVQRTMTYTAIFDNLRTDERFRNFCDPEHHHKASPLILIEPTIDMISLFVLDFMHLGFLGASAKLTDCLCTSSSPKKISQTSRYEISRRLIHIKSQIPCEFQRQLRTLTNVSKWKATEHKLFLLYLGPIVLKKILNTEMYNHFILLHLSSRLLWSEETATTHIESARVYLLKFFLDAQNIYGAEWATVNMHHLIHLADDVENLKCSLSQINAFPYENLLGKIKRFLRSPYRSVAQLCRRLHEQSVLKEPAALIDAIKILKEKNGKIFKVKYKGCTFSTASPNNTVLLKNNKICQIKKIFWYRNSMMMRGVLWKVDQDSIFSVPIESINFNICELHGKPSFPTIISIDEVKTKMMKISLNFAKDEMQRTFGIPLLHE